MFLTYFGPEPALKQKKKNIIVSDPKMKHLFTFNHFIAMIPSHQISRVFMWNLNRQNVMGNRAGQRERESTRLVERERRSVGWKCFLRGSEMAVSEMEHLSIHPEYSNQ